MELEQNVNYIREDRGHTELICGHSYLLIFSETEILNVLL